MVELETNRGSIRFGFGSNQTATERQPRRQPNGNRDGNRDGNRNEVFSLQTSVFRFRLKCSPTQLFLEGLASALARCTSEQLDPAPKTSRFLHICGKPVENSDYLAYLKSPWWSQRRNLALLNAGYRCRRCGVTRQLEVHHLSYAHLGAELDEDLEVLCRGCHLGEHFTRTQESVGLYARIISEVLAERSTEDVTGVIEEVKARCAARHIGIHPEQFHAAIARLLPRFQWRPPEKKAELYTVSAPNQPLTKAEATATLRRLGVASEMKHIPQVRILSEEQQDRLRAYAIQMHAIDEQIQRCAAAEAANPDVSAVAPESSDITPNPSGRLLWAAHYVRRKPLK